MNATPLLMLTVFRNNEQCGPYNTAEIRQMLSKGQISQDDLVWHSGLSDWTRLGDAFSPGTPGHIVVTVKA